MKTNNDSFWKAPQEIDFPRMVPARQRLIARPLRNIAEHVSQQFAHPPIREKIRPGMKIAVGVGSRGIARLAETVKAAIENLKRLGADPFIVPAMGSHGGATAEGQVEVLASYGVTESTMQAPIQATMGVIEIGRTFEDLPVYFDAIAAKADGIVVVNRIKMHTDFHGDWESGLVKMLAIGLGKQQGAKIFHQQGFDRFASLIPQVGGIVLEKLPVLLGVAIVEDGRHEVSIVEVVPAAAFFAREKELLREANRMLARIPFSEVDVLVIGEIGKNISGCGMDPNITGRFLVPPLSLETHSPHVGRIAGLRLTDETQGNALGVGGTDVITRALYEAIDYHKTWANAYTAGEVAWARVPVVAETDRDAVAFALRTAPRVRPETARFAWIKNTLELEYLEVSESLRSAHPDAVEWLGPPERMAFDSAGSLVLRQGWKNLRV